ncbi:MAG: hypothetical protein ACRYHQ_17670 [Janthinobacterium lividum]
MFHSTTRRERFRHQGGLTALIDCAKLTDGLGLPSIGPADDRMMLCGSPAHTAGMVALLDDRGGTEGSSAPGTYVTEKAFVEK